MKVRRGKAWTPKLSREAERDYANIIAWTVDTFGSRQAQRYRALFKEAHARLAQDPVANPARMREDLGAGYRILHLSRPGRHYLIYRVEETRVVIVRILHDSMELSRHVGE
jgi:toxin ParE1/3/4